ncbi:MAG: hypothetical protein ACRDRU_29605 [Pseudonocardiaceae bacterium]
MEWFTAEHAVLLAAIDYAAAQGFDIHTWQLPCILTPFLYMGAPARFVATHKTAVAAAERLGDRAAQALILATLGTACFSFGRCHEVDTYVQEAHTYLQRGRTLYQGLDDRNGQAKIYYCLSKVCDWQGQHSQALTYAQYALDLYMKLGDTYYTTGNHSAAHHAWQQALDLLLYRLDHHTHADTVRTVRAKLATLSTDPYADSYRHAKLRIRHQGQEAVSSGGHESHQSPCVPGD